ncbi:MAG: hypothetical protein DWQ54_10325 [Microcystis flos-aquae TF09]|uniref:Uncharacterized protein n=1 Tax=Microcystis flos-aquae TF09 TaxID=2060473 RepID=A0A3E0L7F7_9CHRO|nr:MAG: hypothetical protein DWQ54_10325 [Microcystis flos-aquae TF09]
MDYFILFCLDLCKRSIALTYVHAYQPDGPLFDFGTGGAKIGTAPANAPFNGPVSSNSYGVSGFGSSGFCVETKPILIVSSAK